MIKTNVFFDFTDFQVLCADVVHAASGTVAGVVGWASNSSNSSNKSKGATGASDGGSDATMRLSAVAVPQCLGGVGGGGTGGSHH
jgi:hypothetical protein